MNSQDIGCLKMKLTELEKSLRRVSQQREQNLAEWKGDNIIIPKDVIAYGLNEMQDGSQCGRVKIRSDDNICILY